MFCVYAYVYVLCVQLLYGVHSLCVCRMCVCLCVWLLCCCVYCACLVWLLLLLCAPLSLLAGLSFLLPACVLQSADMPAALDVDGGRSLGGRVHISYCNS